MIGIILIIIQNAFMITFLTDLITVLLMSLIIQTTVVSKTFIAAAVEVFGQVVEEVVVITIDKMEENVIGIKVLLVVGDRMKILASTVLVIVGTMCIVIEETKTTTGKMTGILSGQDR